MKVEDVLKLNINLKPEQLRQLSEDINKTLSLPKNIGSIINETAGDLLLAKTLNEDAEKKQMAAKNILQVAERVETALAEAQSIQKNVDDGILTTTQNILDANNSITNVKTETGVTQENVQKVLDDINVIETKLKTLQTGFLKNVRDANEVKSEASTLIQEVEDTEKKASQLLASYREASNKLDTRAQIAKTTKYNSQNLLEKASQLSANTTLKLRELGDAEQIIINQEESISKLAKDVDELYIMMSTNLDKISSQSDHYRTCNN
jgi:chromosome segregation ATPase